MQQSDISILYSFYVITQRLEGWCLIWRGKGLGVPKWFNYSLRCIQQWFDTKLLKCDNMLVCDEIKQLKEWLIFETPQLGEMN